MPHIPRHDERTAGLSIAHAIARVTNNQNHPRPEGPPSAILGVPSGDNPQTRAFEVRGEFRTGPSLDLNGRLPRAGQAGSEKPLPFGPFEADARVARVEERDKFGVDPNVVADLGDDNDGDRGIGLAQSSGIQGPRSANNGPPGTRWRSFGLFCSSKVFKSATLAARSFRFPF